MCKPGVAISRNSRPIWTHGHAGAAQVSAPFAAVCPRRGVDHENVSKQKGETSIAVGCTRAGRGALQAIFGQDLALNLRPQGSSYMVGQASL